MSALPDRPGLLRASATSDGVALVRFDDAPRSNALSYDMADALHAVFARISESQTIKAVVLAGTPELFCSGASRQVLTDLISGRRNSAELLLPRLLLDCPVPCLAAMAGHAVGGGFAFGIAADIVLLGRESRYWLNFLEMGFTPGMGVTRLLEHVMSPALAHELMLSGEARLGRHFEGRSGINYVLPRAEVETKALDLAARIAEKPRGSLAALKSVLSLPRRQAFEAARTDETLMHTISLALPEVASLVEDMFADAKTKKEV